MYEYLSSLQYPSLWILSETKFRAFELGHFLKKNDKNKSWQSKTILDGFRDVAHLINNDPLVYKTEHPGKISSRILEIILNNSEFQELRKEIALVLEESSQSLKLKNLNYLLSAFSNFSNSLRLQQNIDSTITQIIDQAGNTLDKKQKIAELIELSNLLSEEITDNKLADQISTMDNLLLSLNTSKIDNLKLPEAIIVDQASSYSKLQLEIFSHLSKKCNVEIFVKAPILEIAEEQKLLSFKELSGSLLPSKKHFCNLIFNINRYKSNLSFKEIKNYNESSENLISYLFDASLINNNNFKLELPLALWKNNTPREEVTRLAKSIGHILKNYLASPDEIHIICLYIEEYQSLFEEIFPQYEIPFIIPRGKRLSETTLGNFYLSYLNWFFNPTLETLEKLAREQLFQSKDIEAQAIFDLISFAQARGIDNDLFSNDHWESFFSKTPSQFHPTIDWIKSELNENTNLIQNIDNDLPKILFKKLNSCRYRFKKEFQALPEILKERSFLEKAIKITRDIISECFESLKFAKSNFKKLGIEEIVFIENFLLEKLKSEFLQVAYEEGNIIISEILDSRGLQGKLNYVLAANSENFPAKNLKQHFTNEYDELSHKIQEVSGTNSSIYESYSLIANLISNSRELVFSFSQLSNNSEATPADFLTLLSKFIKTNNDVKIPTILKDYSYKITNLENNNLFSKKSIEQLLSKKTNEFTAYDTYLGKNISAEKIIEQLNKRYNQTDNSIPHYSTSSLEEFADCPQKFFFSKILGIREEIADLSKTLSREVGNIVHTCLKEFFKQQQFKLITADNFDSACKSILKIAEIEFENSKYDWELNQQWLQAKNSILRGLDQAGDTAKRGYLKAALFYNKELINSIPDLLECPFGLKENEQPALKIANNDRELRVVGKVDRIDRVSTDKNSEIAAIWDYKTGTATPYNKVEKGKSLQIPLYALAAQQNITPNNLTKRGAIFSLKQANRSDEDLASYHKGVLVEHLAITRKSSRLFEDSLAVENQCEKVKEHVLKLDQSLRAGEFQQKLDTEGCAYCEFKNICQRNESLIQIKTSKLEINNNENILIENSSQEFLDYEDNNKPLLELSAEQEAACDINSSIALIAAAGSGKTTVLIRRILQLILAGESILSIVAITFTEKAAEEIKQRVSSAINTILEYNSLANQKISEKERQLLLQAKILLPLSAIGTIHSFAGILLGLDPLASKNSFSLKIVTGEEQKKIAKAAIEKTLNENPQNLVVSLLNFGLSWRNLVSRINHFLSFPRELFLLNNSYTDKKVINDILEKLNAGSLATDVNYQATEISRNFCELASYAYQKYSELKKEEAVLDFENLIISAKECVSNNSKRAKILKQRATKLFRHFLIDEFQDTDSYQWEIIKNITPEIFSLEKILPQDTLPQSILKQSILIVGDPQQAIYGFRGGDSSIFLKAISEIKSSNGKLLFLRNNYRSEEHLINFYNSYFSDLFSCDFSEDNNSKVSTATTYEEMYANKKSSETKIPGVSFLVNNPDTDIEEAAYLASYLKKYLEKNPLAEDTAILCRKNDHLQEIACALDVQNIGYNIKQSNRTLELNEIKQFENLLKYLNNSSDNISLAGVLRSTIFGLSDEDLFFYYQKLETPLFKEINQKLSSWKSLSKYLSISNLLKLIICEQDLEQIYRQANETQAYRNISMFIDTLAQEEKNNLVGPSIINFLNWLDLKRSSNFQLPTKTDNQKISLMTMHNAKGLEFDLVILAYIDYRLPPEHDFVIGEYAGSKLLGIKVEDEEDSFTRAKTPLQNLIEESSTALTCAEERRLFYVACTRARKNLLFSFDQKKGFLGNQKKIKELTLTARKANVFLKSNPYYWFEQLLNFELSYFNIANPLKSLNLPLANF